MYLKNDQYVYYINSVQVVEEDRAECHVEKVDHEERSVEEEDDEFIVISLEEEEVVVLTMPWKT